LLVTRNDGLYRRDLAAGRETKVATAPSGRFITFPAWAPDGKRFAYILSLPFQPNGDWGDDLYLADADGRNQKLILKHDGAGARLESPSWLPDGSALLYGYLHLVFDKSGNLQQQVYEVRRLEIGSSTASTVLRDAGAPQLCRDGSRFAFLGFDRASNTWAAVGFATAQGGDARTLASTKDGLLTFYGAAPSSDCTTVVFAAVGPGPQGPPNGGLPLGVQSAGTSGILAPAASAVLPRPHAERVTFGRVARPADGSPWDLWLVSATGGGLRQLTHIGEDQPYPAWSPDGGVILCVGTYALYEVTLSGEQPRSIAPGEMHGQLSWWQG
jgi:Tol biopolymer transport system component